MSSIETLFNQPDSLKKRTDGYSWYEDHKADRHYVKVRLNGRKTQVEDIDALWVVPS